MSAPSTPRTFVGYLRVSTARQGASGLGLEAQQAAIKAFLGPDDRLLEPSYVEVESGRNSDRPKLAEAMARCRKTGATLLIAKLDRLARSVRFISALMESGVHFVAADMPTATPFMIHVYAAVAEEEARAISRRTKVALEAAKARGKKLGGDRGYRPTSPPDGVAGSRAASVARSREADHAAHRLASVVAEVRAVLGGTASLRAIAEGLTQRGIGTPRGAAWTATGVRRVLARLGTGGV